MINEGEKTRPCPVCRKGTLTRRDSMWRCDACPMGFTDNALRALIEPNPNEQVTISNPLGINLGKFRNGDAGKGDGHDD